MSSRSDLHTFALSNILKSVQGEENRMSPVMNTSTKARVRPNRVLVVDDEPGLIELVTDVVGRSSNCRLFTALNLAQAQRIHESEKIESLLVDLHEFAG